MTKEQGAAIVEAILFTMGDSVDISQLAKAMESEPKAIKGYIQYLKENNCKVGIAIKPNTPVEEVYEYIPYIHMVLVMAAEPGYGGQKLNPNTIERVRKLKQQAEVNNWDIDIEVDCGITLENHIDLIKAGTDILVLGSAIWKSSDYTETIAQFKKE